MSAPTGYILQETRDIVVIATTHSENEKTGDMIQVWILVRNESPADAILAGHDSLVCGDCKLRGTAFKGRTCYVNMANAPTTVWNAYQRGRYPYLDTKDYPGVFTGRAVRFGAYGDPVLIPLSIVKRIVRLAKKTTGYTHQWRWAHLAGYKRYLMASCDSMRDYIQAKALGWRTFRVRQEHGLLFSSEIICPASNEAGKRTQCAKCGLCNGTASKTDRRKDIVIVVHGTGSKNFVRLEELRS